MHLFDGRPRLFEPADTHQGDGLDLDRARVTGLLQDSDACILERGLELLDGQAQLRASDTQLVCARLVVERRVQARE